MTKLTEGYLVTPTFEGSSEEQLDALNLWTATITGVRKASQLASKGNAVAFLEALINYSRDLSNEAKGIQFQFQQPIPPVEEPVEVVAFDIPDETRMAEMAGIRQTTDFGS